MFSLDLMRTLALSFLLGPIAVMAGGDSFLSEIASLTAKGHDEYRLDLIQYTTPYRDNGHNAPAHIVVHLRFKQSMFTRDCPACPTKEKYLAAIESLKAQAVKGGRFSFGIMSGGFEPIKGRKGEFQSNALCILKEFNGREVVYSFAGPT